MNIKQLIAPGVVGIGVLAGVAGGSAINALSAGAESAATSSTSTTSSGNATTAPQGPHQANGVTETELTGDELSKATAAAKAKVTDGTVVRAETDAEGAKYEVHMKKSDGTQVTVKLDADFNVTSVENGMA